LQNDDKSNIDSALQLWICVTLFNSELLEKIYIDYY